MSLISHFGRVLAVFLSCIVGLAASGSASAATVVLMGNTVIYEYDDVLNAGALALFGTPTITGDVVTFTPPSFRAESIDGVATTTGPGGTDVVTANFIFDKVWSMNQNVLQTVQVTEFGDYEIINDGSVGLDLLLTVSNNMMPLQFDNDLASLDYTGDSGGLKTFLTTASVSPASLFATNPWDVKVTIQNTLTAFTDANGETAWIQKKLSFVASETAVIPVPAAAWLFGSALLAMGVVRRK